MNEKTITKAKLKRLYETMNNKDICKMLDITEPTLLSYLKKLNIKLKGKGNRKAKPSTKITLER